MPDNPLAGIRVPSIDEIVTESLSCLGEATVDLGNPKERARLHAHLRRYLGSAIRWRMHKALQQATGKALEHVIKLMEDEGYQEKRAARRRESAARRVEKLKDRARQQNADVEARRQAEKGLVQ